MCPGHAVGRRRRAVCAEFGAAEWHVAQAVLGGGLEERLRSGCPLAEVVQQLPWHTVACARSSSAPSGRHGTMCPGHFRGPGSQLVDSAVVDSVVPPLHKVPRLLWQPYTRSSSATADRHCIMSLGHFRGPDSQLVDASGPSLHKVLCPGTQMVDTIKQSAAAVEGVAAAAIAQDSIDAARRDEAEDTGMKRLIEEQLYTFFTTQETPMPPVKRTQFRAGTSPGPVVKTGLSMRPSPLSSEPHYLDWKTALATALPSFENGMPPDSMRCLGLFSIALEWVLEYLLDDPRLQPVADLYCHAACYGAFIAGCELLVVELRELLVAACVTDGITPAFGQRLEAVVHSMEAIDDGHWFRLAYLGKY
eukprot:jgi/Tetstr1/438479/TSEL_027034.t1